MQTTLTLWLVVERNNQYARGKKRAIESIERMLSSVYGMKRLPLCWSIFCAMIW